MSRLDPQHRVQLERASATLELNGEKDYAEAVRELLRITDANVGLSPAQWVDVYYFARSVDLPDFIERAQKVFNDAGERLKVAEEHDGEI